MLLMAYTGFGFGFMVFLTTIPLRPHHRHPCRRVPLALDGLWWVDVMMCCCDDVMMRD